MTFWRNIYVLPAFAILLNCGGELPLLELSLAKEDITRAKKLGASEFAPLELAEAERSLVLAHSAASEQKVSDSKKNADYSIQKSLDALERSAPKASAKARDLATATIDLADEAYATALATDEFDQSISLRKQGDSEAESADKSLSLYFREAEETKKNALRRQAIASYEASFDSYSSSQSLAEKAKTISLSRRDEIKDSARDIEEDLITCETYSEGNDPRIESERIKLATAFQNIDEGKTKLGAMQLEDSRRQVKFLLADSISTYARKRNDIATDKVNAVNDLFAEIDPSIFGNDPNLLNEYESAREILGASNEALASSGNLYTQEKFLDSIQQSDEAIRYADSLAEQLVALKESAVAASLAKRGATIETSSNSKPTAREEYSKTYKVQSRRPSDSLWRIAGKKEHYGNPRKWPKIYDANRDKIRIPALIYPGQVLKIPSTRETGSSPSPEKKSTVPVTPVPKATKRLPVPDSERILQPPLEDSEDPDSPKSTPLLSDEDETMESPEKDDGDL